MDTRTWMVFLVLAGALLAGCTSDKADPCQSDPAAEGCAPPEPHNDFLCADGTLAPSPDACPPPPPVPEPLPHHPGDGTMEAARIDIPGHDGHMVPANLCRPAQAGPNATVPMLLHSHGWAGTKSECDAFTAYAAAGFGVVSFDMRGFGEAGDVARIHHIEYEIQDVRRVIDFVAGLDWVHLDGEGDPRLGALGGSYGGGYQLLTAALDSRLDAIAPEITWSSLTRSLAPNDAPKSLWLDLLYGGGMAAGTLADEITQAYAWVMATNDIPDGALPGEPNVWPWLVASSPATYPGAIDIPTLLIQGTSDTLFNFNEAEDNYRMIAATGAPVSLVTHLNGHIIHTQGTIPDAVPIPFGVQPPAGADPCGEPDDLIIPFYGVHLIGLNASLGPAVCMAMEDGTTVTGDVWPLPGTVSVTSAVDAPLMVVAQGVPLTPDALGEAGIPGLGDAQDALAGNGVVEVVVYEADAESYLVGTPTLNGSRSAADADAIAYWYLKHVHADGAHIINAQVRPDRFAGPTTSEAFTLEMGGVGAHLMPGDKVVLVVANFNDQFLQNGNRVPGALLFEDLNVTLPILLA